MTLVELSRITGIAATHLGQLELCHCRPTVDTARLWLDVLGYEMVVVVRRKPS